MLDPDNMKVRVTRNVRFLEHLNLVQREAGRPGTRLQAGREVEVLERSHSTYSLSPTQKKRLRKTLKTSESNSRRGLEGWET